MFSDKWLSTKVGAKLLSDFIMFSIFSSEIPLDFQVSIRVVPLKYLMYFFSWHKCLIIYKYPEGKDFAPLKILDSCIKSFFNPFFGIFLTFLDSSFF